MQTFPAQNAKMSRRCCNVAVDEAQLLMPVNQQKLRVAIAIGAAAAAGVAAV